MCNFKSAWVKRNGDIIMSPYIDSHEMLNRAYSITKDDIAGRLQNAIRIEFFPTKDILDVDSYKLNVDEKEIPDWFDSAMRFDITERMKEKIKAMIILDDVGCIIEGQWIIAGNAKVNLICGSAQIGSVYGSAQIGLVCDSAQIGLVCGSAKIERDLRKTQ